MLHVCIVAYNRYDLLPRQFASIAANAVPVEMVYVMDRGNRPGEIADAARGVSVDIVPNVGGNSLAAAFNWFLRNVPDDRILAGEDVHYGPQAFHNVLASDAGCLALCDGVSGPFSAFVLRDALVQRVGYFDEGIHPDGVYFFDWDYQARMGALGIDCAPWYDVHHSHKADGGGSLGAKTPAQIAAHHASFAAAQARYVAKWGRMPDRDMIVAPFDGGPYVSR